MDNSDKSLKYERFCEIKEKQAGAELGQAQGLA